MSLQRSVVTAGALAGLLIVSFAFGGGGSRFGVANLTVQLAGLIALGACLHAALDFWKRAPLTLRTLALSCVMLPILQLIPLPSSLAEVLPGRELAIRTYDLAAIDAAMPFSLYPLRTALAASALITPLAVLMLGWNTVRNHLFNLGWVIVLMGIIAFILGALQLLDGAGRYDFWPEGLHKGVLKGPFANRNTAGLYLVGALGFALLLPAPRQHKAVALVRLSSATMILAAIIATQSRTALVLSAIPLLLGLLSFALNGPRTIRHETPQRRTLISGVVIALVLAVFSTAVVVAPGRLADTIERFEGVEGDARRFIWEDATYSASRYWPAGAGMGTFDDVFQLDEAIENIASGRRAGRAHNEYIEVAIEAGVVGLALIAAWLAYIGWLTWQARRSADRWAAWAASGFLLAVALQSITDYPLRNQTMLAMVAFALMLLVRIANPRPHEQCA